MSLFVIQFFNKGQWHQLRMCPPDFVEDDARDMLEVSRSKIVKRELRLVKVTPPSYVPPEIEVIDA